MEAAYHTAGIYFPFTDLIVTDPYKDMANGLQLAYYMGQSHVVGGTTTDIVAYIDNGVFMQVWIGAEDKLPRMVHAVFLNDPERMRHQLELSNWQLDVAVPLEAFSPQAPARRSASNSRIHTHSPHPALNPRRRPIHLNRISKESGIMLNKIVCCTASLAMMLVLCGTASGYAHSNRYGGSTSHSYGSTSHSSAYGTSTSHTYGEGSSHTNEYGGSTSHNYYGGTTHTNTYGGTTSGEAGYGAEHTTPYGTTAYASAYHPPTAYYGYHPPTTVGYYGASCYNCSSGSTAGEAAVAWQSAWQLAQPRLFKSSRPNPRALTNAAIPPARPARTQRMPTRLQPMRIPAAANANAAAANANAAAATPTKRR